MRVAVLGLGFMGSTHLKAWRNVSGATVTAVYSTDEQKLTGDLSGVQGNLGGPGEMFDFSNVKKYRAVSELLEDPEIDAVDICLPTHLHSAAAMTALRSGKHVLVEKPMALTTDIAYAMIQEARLQRRTLMAAQVLRFIPAYRALASELSGGRHGSVRSATFRRRCAAPFWNKWLGEPEKSGGGVFDLLIHDIDMCIALFGMPFELSATGYADLPAGIDTIHTTLHYQEIPSVVVTGGWHHKKSYPFSMEYTVVTDGATFEYSSTQGDIVTMYGSDGEKRELDLVNEDGFEAELRYFTECCRLNRPPAFCPPEQSAQAVGLSLLMLDARKLNGEKISCKF